MKYFKFLVLILFLGICFNCGLAEVVDGDGNDDDSSLIEAQIAEFPVIIFSTVSLIDTGNDLGACEYFELNLDKSGSVPESFVFEDCLITDAFSSLDCGRTLSVSGDLVLNVIDGDNFEIKGNVEVYEENIFPNITTCYMDMLLTTSTSGEGTFCGVEIVADGMEEVFGESNLCVFNESDPVKEKQ
jgi:hypothetical protein